MIQRVTVENYALIRHLDITLGSGLNIITGETGAGKSILLGALGLILGNRAENTGSLSFSSSPTHASPAASRSAVSSVWNTLSTHWVVSLSISAGVTSSRKPP